jgi:hypothetical protein
MFVQLKSDKLFLYLQMVSLPSIMFASSAAAMLNWILLPTLGCGQHAHKQPLLRPWPKGRQSGTELLWFGCAPAVG